MPLVPFAAGQKLTATLINTALDISRKQYQTLDQTVNNSATLVSSTSMVLSVVANGVYIAEMFLAFDTNATADAKYNLLLPSGAVVVRHSLWGNATGDTTVNAAVTHDASDVNGFATGGVAGGTQISLRPLCAVVVSSTAGNCTVQFAQNTANASNTILKAGSWLQLTKVA